MYWERFKEKLIVVLYVATVLVLGLILRCLPLRVTIGIGVIALLVWLFKR